MARDGARRSRWYLAAGTLLALTAYGAADAFDVVPGVLTTAGADAGTAPRFTPGAPGPPGTPGAPGAPGAGTPGAPGSDDAGGVPLPLVVDGVPVLAAPTGPAPGPAALARALAAPLRAPALGPSVGLEVRDAATGAVLASVDAARPRTPASTAKVLTALAVASSADLGERAATTVVDGPARDQITLVAGGDMLLAAGRGTPGAVAGRAGVADLADQVAAALRAQGRRAVRLVLDLRTAAGPAYGPDWAPADIAAGLTGPVTMLGLADDRALPGRPAPADPPGAVATALRSALTARKISVTGPLTRIVPGTRGVPAAGTGGTGAQLGRVESAPLGSVLSLALATSDNALTEALARRVAVTHGVRATFPTVAAWVRAQVAAAGVDVRGVRLADASGLSRASAVPARTLAEVLLLARDPAYRDSFGQVVADLPVAGLSGTMSQRFRGVATRSAAGIVRAKTGTLTGVASLAGTLVDADGRLLLFVVMADRTPPPPVGGMDRSRAALDAVVTAVAACGCR